MHTVEKFLSNFIFCATIASITMIFCFFITFYFAPVPINIDVVAGIWCLSVGIGMYTPTTKAAKIKVE
jgi:hypothetical protein